MVAVMKYSELKDRMVAEGRTTYENLAYLSFIVDVKLLREEQSISQTEFAKLLDLDLNVYKSIEDGETIADTLSLFKMSDILNAQIIISKKKNT